MDSKPTKKKKVYGRDISRRSNVSRNDVCICPCVITPRGWTSLPGRGVFFFGVYSNKQINKKNLEYRRKFADFSTNFPGNSKSENPALCEWFMLKLLNPPLMKLLNPPLLIRTYFTTLEHKTYTSYTGWGVTKKKMSAHRDLNVKKGFEQILEIIFDLLFDFPINNIISLSSK